MAAVSNKLSDYVEELARGYPTRLKRKKEALLQAGLSPWPQQQLEVLQESHRLRSLKNYDSERSRKESSRQRKEKRMLPTANHYSQPRKKTVAGDLVRIYPWQFVPGENRVSQQIPVRERHTTSSGSLNRQTVPHCRTKIKTLLERKLQHPLKSAQVLIGEKLQTESSCRANCTLFFFKGRSPGVQSRIKNIKLLREPSYRQELFERLGTEG